MILREIKSRIKGNLLWIAAFAFFIIGGMTKFDAFQGSDNNMNQMVQALPRIMRIMYGMEGVDISKFSGYFGILLFYVFIMLAIHGAFLGVSLMYGEFKDRTADFLFTKPASRTSLLIKKCLAALGIILIIQVAIGLFCAYVFHRADSLKLLPETLFASLIIHLFFFAAGFAFSLWAPSPKQGQQISLLVILLGYLAIIFSSLYDIPALANITPLGYFKTKIYEANLLPGGLLILLLSLILIISGLYAFKKKDIPA